MMQPFVLLAGDKRADVQKLRLENYQTAKLVTPSVREPYSPECVTPSCAGRRPKKGAVLCPACSEADRMLADRSHADKMSGYLGYGANR